MFPVLTSTVSSHSTHSHPHTHSQPHSHSHPRPERHPTSAHPTAAPVTSPSLSTSTASSSSTSAPSSTSSSSTLPSTTSPSAYQLVHKAGYLHKEGEVWKTWKRRYFVLSSLLLSYYTDKDAQQPKGVILLEGCEVRVSSRTDREHLFEVFDEADERRRRVYFLQADSEAERSEWVSAIKTNILHELQRSRAFVDEVDRCHLQVQQLTEQLERIHAKQIIADIHAGKHSASTSSSSPSTQSTQPSLPHTDSTASSDTAPADRVLYGQPATSFFTSSSSSSTPTATPPRPPAPTLQPRLAYLEMENARLAAENRSLKEAALAMQGKGDEMAPNVADQAHLGTGQVADAQAMGRDGLQEEVEALRAELAKVRLERSVLKREVVRLMQVNDGLTKAQAAARSSQQGATTTQAR